MRDDDPVPVLIAGGGLVGSSMAMFPAEHGILSLAVERMRSGSPLPRAGHFHPVAAVECALRTLPFKA